MHAGDMSKFYQKVMRDFILKVKQDPVIAGQLECHNVEMHQLETTIREKMKQPKLMFKRAINTQNEIEKERRQKSQLERSQQFSYSPVETHNIKQQVIENSDSSCSDDLQQFSKHGAEASHHNIQTIARQIKQEQLERSAGKGVKIEERVSDRRTKAEKEEKQEFSKKEQEERIHKRQANDYLQDDFSDIDHEEEDCLKRLRHDSKIHVLGTYETLSKKHKFSSEKTHVMLENVFIKVEGLNKELFLRKLHYTSQKKVQD